MEAKTKIFVLVLVMIMLVSVHSLQAQTLDEDGKLIAKTYFLSRCGKCHSIERPLRKNKTPEEWKKTVDAMNKKAHGMIKKNEVEEIIYFLSSKSLFEKKCKNCHSEFRALDLIKSKEEWDKTVKTMQKKEAGWITDEEAERIKIYLFTVQGGE